MKTKSFLIAAIVMLSAAVTTFGEDKPSNVGLVVVPVKGTQVFKIIYKGENAGSVKISLTNSEGVVIYSETLSSVEGFILPLNLSDVQYGEYIVTVADATGRRTEKLTYLPQIAPASAIHIAKVAGENRYLVVVPGQGDQVVNVKIFDKSNNLLHEDTKSVNGNFGVIYNTAKVSGSNGFTFQVTDSTGNSKVVNY